MEATTLKERLFSIQEQQKVRFKERKASKSSERSVLRESNILISAHQDDLDLRTVTQEGISENAECEQSTTDDSKEVGFLRHQLEHLQLENAQFRSNLKEKDAKLAEVEKCREEEKRAFGGVGTSATQKIVELSKRNRELNADIASEKNRVRQLQKKIKELERGAVTVDDSKKERTLTSKTVSKKNDTDTEEDPSSVAHLQEQLKHSQLKTAEHRNHCQVLKQELKLAQKVITKEVGDGVSMSALLSGVSGWRGRAQQIATLQNRVAELKEQLERHRPGVSRGASISGRGEYTSAQTDVRQKAMLQRMEKERRVTLDETKLELETLQSEHSKLKQQSKALKARNKILTEEVKQMKSQLPSREQHHPPQHPTQYTRTPSTASTASTVDEGCSPRYQDWRRERKQLQEANDGLQEHLKRCLTELRSLKRDQQQATKSSSRQKVKSINGITLPPVIPPPGSRKGQHSVSELPLERKSLSAGHVLPAIQQSQSDSRSIETTTLAQVTVTERDRLLELTSVLQQRLDATTDKLLRVEAELRDQKQQTIHLEKKLGRLHGACDIKSGGHKEDVGELEMRLEVQIDENAVLKETLEVTRHEKMEDMKLYRTMLQETKQLFMDSVRKIQNQNVT